MTRPYGLRAGMVFQAQAIGTAATDARGVIITAPTNIIGTAGIGYLWFVLLTALVCGVLQRAKQRWPALGLLRLWGIALHEWRGASGRTKRWLLVSIMVLVLSTMVVGYGNYLGTLPGNS